MKISNIEEEKVHWSFVAHNRLMGYDGLNSFMCPHKLKVNQNTGQRPIPKQVEIRSHGPPLSPVLVRVRATYSYMVRSPISKQFGTHDASIGKSLRLMYPYD